MYERFAKSLEGWLLGRVRGWLDSVALQWLAAVLSGCIVDDGDAQAVGQPAAAQPDGGG